jgi:hypothetical protein
MKHGTRLVILASCYLIAGCDASLKKNLFDYDEDDLKGISVREIQAPHDVRCFLLMGSREKLGQTLSCFPVGGETGARR